MKTLTFKLFLPLLIFLYACESYENRVSELDTPVSGKINLVIDENIRPLADLLVNSFEASYPDAFLIQKYNQEDEIIQLLYDDSARLALMTRPLQDEELAWFEKQKFIVEQMMIGSDAVVFILNKNNPDSTFTTTQLLNILSGKDTLWENINQKNNAGKIDIVFDNGKSCNIRYLTDTLLGNIPLGKNCFAVNSNKAVVEYVRDHPGAIGVVGLNWIGDKDNENDVLLRQSVKFAAVGTDTATATTPHQSALVTKKYPFTRHLWLVKIGKRAGLGTGFATFVMGDRGQLIVQKSGLAPAKPAERQVEIK
ncbi:MAG: substrate-binding domain-containing protein [Bacteroidia bacterium]